MNSMDSKGEAVLKIMAPLAHQKSQTQSQNVEAGPAIRIASREKSSSTTKWLPRYTKDNNKRLVMKPK